MTTHRPDRSIPDVGYEPTMALVRQAAVRSGLAEVSREAALRVLDDTQPADIRKHVIQILPWIWMATRNPLQDSPVPRGLPPVSKVSSCVPETPRYPESKK